MPLRYSSKAAAVALAGTVFNHGLQQIPDGAICFPRGPTPGTPNFYLTGAPTSTSATFAASGAAGTADVYVWVDHSIIK